MPPIVVWFTPDGPAYRNEDQPGLVLVPLPLSVPLSVFVDRPYMDSPVMLGRVKQPPVSPCG